MNPRLPVIDLLPSSGLTCFIIPALFAAAECNALLNQDRRAGFVAAAPDYPVYYRNNDRQVTDDAALAEMLFEKVKPYLPETITITTGTIQEQGNWQLAGLNTRLRFCRYAAGQYFHRHLDGVHHRSASEQSKLTFMIYLNGATDFAGGRTLFYRSKDDTDIWTAYTPQQGDLIVFDHNLWHEGEELQRGEKFVLRSDILYRKDIAATAALPYEGHLGYIWSLLRFNDDILLSGGRDKSIHVWDKNGRSMQVLQAHTHSILCMAKTGTRSFISGSRDRKIMLWQQQTDGCFSPVRSFGHHTATVLCVCSISDNIFASAGADKIIYIMQTDGTELARLQGHTDWIWQLVLLPGGHLASCSQDGSIKLWDIATGTVVHSISNSSPAVCMAYHPAADMLISGHIDGAIAFHPLDGSHHIRSFQAHNGIVRTLLLLDDERIASGGEDNKVNIWRLSDQCCLHTIQHRNFVQSLAQDENGVIHSAAYDGSIRRFAIDC